MIQNNRCVRIKVVLEIKDCPNKNIDIPPNLTVKFSLRKSLVICFVLKICRLNYQINEN